MLHVDYSVPDSAGPMDPSRTDLLIVPGENERDAHSKAAIGDRIAGVGGIGAPGYEPWPVDRLFVWAPTTLKRSMDAGLRLARMVHRLPEMMRLLGDREMALKKAAGRKSDARRDARKAICLIHDTSWRIMGLWAPDLIERAGGEPILLEAGDPSTPLRAGDLKSRLPDTLLVGMHDPTGRKEERLRAILAEALFEGEAYLVQPETVLTSGPALHETVLRFAAALNRNHRTPKPDMKRLRLDGFAGGNTSESEGAT